MPYKRKEQFTKTCLSCGREFQTNRTRKSYCDGLCYWKVWSKTHPRLKVERSSAPDYVIDSDEFRKLSHLCVYAWKRGDQYLYIGCAERGMARIARHNVIDKIEPVQPGDVIELYMIEGDYLVAETYERSLILKHKPKYNALPAASKASKEPTEKTCQECGAAFWSASVVQRYCSPQCRKASWEAQNPAIHRDELRAKLLNVLETLEVNQ